MALGPRLFDPDANPAGVVYGVLAMGTLVAAEGSRRQTYPDVLEACLLALALYWIAHAYARHFSQRGGDSDPKGLRSVGHALAHESSILAGAAVPVVALVLAWAAGATLGRGVLAAVWVAGAELVVLETLSGVRRKLAPRALVGEVVTGVALGAGVLGVRIVLH